MRHRKWIQQIFYTCEYKFVCGVFWNLWNFLFVDVFTCSQFYFFFFQLGIFVWWKCQSSLIQKNIKSYLLIEHIDFAAAVELFQTTGNTGTSHSHPVFLPAIGKWNNNNLSICLALMVTTNANVFLENEGYHWHKTNFNKNGKFTVLVEYIYKSYTWQFYCITEFFILRL